jgi:hypothetical protein
MPPAASPARPLSAKLVAAVFLLALVFNLWGVSTGWKHINLPGYEFRQTQTAISALFIQREHNFSLAYPTPVLGKPWSIPFEFPLYQWTTVVVSNTTGWPLVEAGRLVSAFCFYLGLPALAGLLRRLGAPGPHRLVVLSLVLTSPLYVYYTRAILIETMALMFGLWYLYALVESLERRSIPWLALAALAGTGAGLVKVTTFMVFVLPALAWSLWQLWLSRAKPGETGAGPLRRTFGWLAATQVVPFAATLWWLRFSDAVKALNPSGAGLTSAQLVGFNFGLGRRLDGQVWAACWNQITENIVSPAALLTAGVALCFANRWWRQIALCLGLFVTVQVIFPVLYSVHGYYYIACAFLLLLAMGFAVAGLLESPRLPRWVSVPVWIGLCAAQGWLYVRNHYPSQRAPGDGGGLASALQEISEPDDTLIVAGDDWSSIIPYYAQRRALMLRSELPERPAYLKTAFGLMQGERVAALVLIGPERNNTALLDLAVRHFDLDPRPIFTWRHENRDATVYLDRQLRPNALAIFGRRGFHEVTLVPVAGHEPNPLLRREYAYKDLLPRFQKIFRLINPRPLRFYSTFGPELWHADQPGQERFASLPDTKLWFALPAGTHRVRTNLEVVSGAWQGVPDADASDGVELVAAAVRPGGHREVLQRRYLNPRLNPADRGIQSIDWTIELPAGAELELSVNVGPAGNGARDWASLGPITIE